MEESKKKVTTEKKNDTEKKKTGAKKSTAKNSSKTKKNTSSAPKSKTKASAEKTTASPKAEVKKETKETTKKIEKKSSVKEKNPKTEEKENKNLEKTIIFDGRESKNISDVVNKLEEDKVVLEDKIVERSKAKKIVVIALAILIFAIIISTSVYVISSILEEDKSNQTLDSNVYQKVSERYSSSKDIDKDENKNTSEKVYDNIETISLARFEEKILEKEDMAVLVASDTCYASMSFEPTIDEVFKAENKTIYKINISSLTATEETRFRTYYAFKSTPTIFTIKAGIVTSDQVGTTTKEELTEWVKENVQ